MAGVLATVADPSPAGELNAVRKTVDKVADIATDASKAANKADFVVTPDGTSVPTSQSVMREGFDNAGFDNRPATQTSEPGQIHTVPTQNGAVDVRTMEGSAHHPRRAVFTEAGTNNPVRVGGEKFRNNEPRRVRREESHLRQNN